MKSVRALLLDFGHTLVDYDIPEDSLAAQRVEIARVVQRELGGETALPAGLVLRALDRVGELVSASYDKGEVREGNLLELYSEAFRWAGREISPQLARQVMEMDHAAIAGCLSVRSSTIETVRDLRAQGYLLAVVSNTMWPPELWLKDLGDLGLAPYVAAVSLSSAVGFRKPHRLIYELALEELGVGADQCLFVGDRIREDVEGPQALGMRAVLTHEFRQEPPEQGSPDAVIQRLSDLVEVLSHL